MGSNYNTQCRKSLIAWMDEEILNVELKSTECTIPLVYTHSIAEKNREYDDRNEPGFHFCLDFSRIRLTSN